MGAEEPCLVGQELINAALDHQKACAQCTSFQRDVEADLCRDGKDPFFMDTDRQNGHMRTAVDAIQSQLKRAPSEVVPDILLKVAAELEVAAVRFTNTLYGGDPDPDPDRRLGSTRLRI